MLAGNTYLLVAQHAEILFLLVKEADVICGRIAPVKTDQTATGHNNPNNFLKVSALHIIRSIRMTLIRRLKKENRSQTIFLIPIQKFLDCI